MQYAILSSGSDATTLWDMTKKTPLNLYRDNNPILRSIALVGAPYGAGGNIQYDYFVSAQNGKPGINIYTWTKDTPIFRCAVSELLGSIAVSPCGTYCAAGSVSGKLYLWDIPTGELLRVWQGHYKSVSSLSFSSCSNFLASGSQDCSVSVWDTAACIDMSKVCDPVQQAHVTPINSWSTSTLPISQLAFVNTPGRGGGSRLLTASLDQTVQLLDVNSGLVLLSLLLPTAASALALSPDHTRVALGLVSGQLIELKLQESLLRLVSAASPFSDNSAISVASKGRAPTQPLNAVEGLYRCAPVHAAAVTALAFVPDDSLLVTASDDGSIKVCDVASMQVVSQIEGHKGPVFALCVLPMPPHLRVVGRHAALPLLPMGPLRKHFTPVGSEFHGSAIGPTDASSTAISARGGVARVFSSQCREEDEQVRKDIMREMEIGLQTLISRTENANQNQENKGGAADGNDKNASIAALEARIKELEEENARWKSVNNKLMSKLQGK